MNNIQQKTRNKIALEMKNISKIFPGTIALQKVSFKAETGTVHGIIGKNGAGKSTLISIMSGLIYPTEGEIIIDGKEYKGFSRIEAKKEGISVISQEPQLVPDQTIVEALFFPNYTKKNGIIKWKIMEQEAKDLLKSPLLSRLKNKKNVRDLSISEQQLLLVFKAIHFEKAKVIILDETTASLTTDDQLILYDFIREQKEAGKAIIFISHRLEEILDICDQVSVIRDGVLIANLERKNLNIEKLSSLIIGTEESSSKKATEYKKDNNASIDLSISKLEDSYDEKSKESLLKLEGFTSLGKFENISFSVNLGEVIGLAGLRGSGRTELLKALIGIGDVETGNLKIKGLIKKINNPSQAIKNRIVYLAEEREKEGLIHNLSILDNITLSSLKHFCYSLIPGIINHKKRVNAAKNLINKLNIKAISHNQNINDLSGGNKQKVVVGKIMATNPLIFLLDEPTRGIDISAKESILDIVNTDLRKNAAILMTSPSIEDLTKVCDRILVLSNGKIVKEYKKPNFQENEIYLAMQGNYDLA